MANVNVSVGGRGGGSQRGPEDQGEASRRATTRKSALFLAVVAVAYVVYLVLSGQLGSFFEAMAGLDPYWVFAGMLAYVVYYILGVSAYVLSVAGDPTSPVGLRDLMSVEASGIFFSNLTPNGAGGAPAQIYRLTRTGLSLGGAGALQYTRFVIYEAGEGVFAAIMLLFRWDFFFSTYGNVFWIGVFIFGFKIIEVTALILVCLFPNVVIRVGNWILKQAEKTGRVKRHDYWHNLINTQVAEFAQGFRSAASNVGNMVATMVVTLVQLGCLYALPWFVLNAFGKSENIVTIMACGSMLELLTSAIPLPGGTGGAEGGFAVLFGDMFGEAAPAGYVVWRMVEYFLPVLAAMPLLGLQSKTGNTIHSHLVHLGVVEGGQTQQAATRVPRRTSGKVSAKNVASVDLTKKRSENTDKGE